MINVRVLKDSQYHSLKMHFLNQNMQENPAIQRGEVIMGTEANKKYLAEKDFSHPAIEEVGSNDLIVIVEAADERTVDDLLTDAQDRLENHLLRETPESNKRLKVLSHTEGKSPFFLRDFTKKRRMGKIHSIFKTSFNVLFKKQLLNFSTVGMPLSPHGCVLKKEKIDRVVNAGQPGDLVKFEEEVLTFYTRGDLFSIDLSQVEDVNLRIPQLPVSAKSIRQSETFQYLSQLNFTEEMGLQQEGPVIESFHTLQAVEKTEEPAIQQAINYLIGRGGGLTPSGDDVLLGFTMVRLAFQPDDFFINYLKEGLKQRSTTAVSTAYYEGLFAGYISSLFLAFLNKMTEKEAYLATRQLIDLITLYGHTSGYDTLFGIYLGLQSL